MMSDRRHPFGFPGRHCYNTSMKAIITAAGLGSRLKPLTDTLPKCMLPVAGTPLLHRNLEALRSAGVDDVVVVTGHCGDRIQGPGIRTVENVRYRENNILHSLFHAREEMDGGFLFAYSDIDYTAEVIRAVMETSGDIVPVVDENWREIYVGRTDHPLEEAELARIVSGDVVEMGKGLEAEDLLEFTGIVRFSPTGANQMMEAFDDLSGRSGNPFPRARTFETAYMTDMLSWLANSGVPVTPCRIRGGWREIDTAQDYDRANAELRPA